MKKLLGISALFFALPVLAALEDGSGLIGIPTANVIGNGIDVRALTSFSLKSVRTIIDRTHPLDLNLAFGGCFNNRIQLYLKGYTLKDYSLDLHYLILKGKGRKPSFAVGVRNLTYRKYISPVGGGGEYDSPIFPDDSLYLKTRPPELGSIYGVMSFKPYPLVEMSFGLGRGEFVGYGPHSHWFNTDIFFKDEKTHPWLTLGLFMGAKLELRPDMFLIADFDGRDVNIGLRYDSPMFQANIAWEKVEQIIGSCPTRIGVELSYKFPLTSKQSKRTVVFTVKDKETDKPLVASKIIFDNTKIHPIMTDSTGQASIKLTPGKYKFKVVKEGYKTVAFPLDLTGNAKNPIPVSLDTVSSGSEETSPSSSVLHLKGIIRGTIIDAITRKPVSAKIYIKELPNRHPIVSNNKTGEFIDTLPTGKFTAKVEANGYKTQTLSIEIGKNYHPTIENLKLYQKLVKHKKLTLRGIHFDTGKATIKPESYPILDEAVKLLKANPDVKVEIAGHTDSVGSASYNLRLSEARANAVRDYLIRHGIEASRLIAKGYGETRPIASNSTKEGRALNRRVEFIVIR